MITITKRIKLMYYQYYFIFRFRIVELLTLYSTLSSNDDVLYHCHCQNSGHNSKAEIHFL